MSIKKLLILRAFAMDYHSGQTSRGYRILSMTYKRLQAKGNLSSLGYSLFSMDARYDAARRTKLYKDLVEKYADKI